MHPTPYRDLTRHPEYHRGALTPYRVRSLRPPLDHRTSPSLLMARSLPARSTNQVSPTRSVMIAVPHKAMLPIAKIASLGLTVLSLSCLAAILWTVQASAVRLLCMPGISDDWANTSNYHRREKGPACDLPCECAGRRDIRVASATRLGPLYSCLERNSLRKSYGRPEILQSPIPRTVKRGNTSTSLASKASGKGRDTWLNLAAAIARAGSPGS
jgi:hypothetical protein